MVNDDRVLGALPKLYGAPAYSRPPVAPTKPVERPFDPDALPLTSELSPDEMALLDQLAARPFDGLASAQAMPASREGPSMLRGRPFRLRSIGSLFRGADRDDRAG